MQKLKSTDIKGIQFHNQRERESQTNPDIDKSKEHLNYDLLNSSKIDYNERIKKEIEERYKGTKKIRKDAVKLCSFMVTSNKAFFDGLDPKEEKRFFEESLKFLQERYGKENMVYAVVHKDEKTPHMHVGMVPITKDGKLAAKEFFGKKSELQQLQDKFHEHVTKKGFRLERGVSSERKHIETQRLKALTAKEQAEAWEQELQAKREEKEVLDSSVRHMENRLGDLGESLKKIKQVDEIKVERGGLFGSKTVKLAVSDFDSIKTLAKASEALRNKNEAYQREIASLREQINVLKKNNERLKEKNHQLEKERDWFKGNYERLDKLMKRMHDFYKERIPEAFEKFEQIKGFCKCQVNRGMSAFSIWKFKASEMTDEEVIGYMKANEEAKKAKRKRPENELER